MLDHYNRDTVTHMREGTGKSFRTSLCVCVRTKSNSKIENGRNREDIDIMCDVAQGGYFE